jgi:hypothetical protein
MSHASSIAIARWHGTWQAGHTTMHIRTCALKKKREQFAIMHVDMGSSSLCQPGTAQGAKPHGAKKMITLLVTPVNRDCVAELVSGDKRPLRPSPQAALARHARTRTNGRTIMLSQPECMHDHVHEWHVHRGCGGANGDRKHTNHAILQGKDSPERVSQSRAHVSPCTT